MFWTGFAIGVIAVFAVSALAMVGMLALSRMSVGDEPACCHWEKACAGQALPPIPVAEVWPLPAPVPRESISLETFHRKWHVGDDGVPQVVEPGEVTDRAAYERAIAEGWIIELGPDETPTVEFEVSR